MPDLRFSLQDLVFALRAGLLCVHDGHLLVIGGDGFDFCYVPGGAVQTGERLEQAAAREWQEELGALAGPCGPLRPVGLIENFFTLNDRRWHELGVYFRLQEPPARWEGRRPLGDDPRQWLEWVALDDLAARRLQPAALTELLGLDGGFRHIVWREADAVPDGPDLRVREHGWSVQVRAHLLVGSERGVLTNIEPDPAFCFLPGGSVRLDESSAEAARREWQEETGGVAAEVRLVGVCEGFDRPQRRQQLSLIYRVTPPEGWTAPPTVQDAPDLSLVWVPRAEVETRPVHPRGLERVLAAPAGEVVWLHEEWLVSASQP